MTQKLLDLNGKNIDLVTDLGPVYIHTAFVNRYWPYYNRYQTCVYWKSRFETQELGPFVFNFADIRRYQTEEEALKGHEELVALWKS